MVSQRPLISPLRSLCSNAWCAQVTVVPEGSRISGLSSGRCHGSNVLRNDVWWGVADQFAAQDLEHIRRKQRGVEVGPEPGDEEHHLGGDEQAHAVAVRYL